jgi:hypothetical protein
MVTLYRIAAAMTLMAATTPPATAAEAWNCITTIGSKSFSFGYRVDGGKVIGPPGSGPFAILENNSARLIYYGAFTNETTRYLANSAPVRVSEPAVNFSIIEKGSGRMTNLSNAGMSALGDRFGNIPPPEISYSQCTPIP